MTYALVKNGAGDNVIISNAVKLSSGNLVYISNLVKKTDTTEVIIFGNNPVGRKVASGPVFVAPERNRTFVV